MKASELRIGNYLSCQGKDLNKVLAISSAEIQLYSEKEEVTAFVFTNNVEPIILNETWLLAFGYSIDESNSAGKVFSFIKEVGFVNDDLKIIYFSKTGKFMRRSLEIKSVHQLQNLYFALVGEELVLQD